MKSILQKLPWWILTGLACGRLCWKSIDQGVETRFLRNKSVMDHTDRDLEKSQPFFLQRG